MVKTTTHCYNGYFPHLSGMGEDITTAVVIAQLAHGM